MKVVKPLLATLGQFRAAWQKILTWIDPWLGYAHDVVKWIRDTLAKVGIKSAKLATVQTTIADLREFGEVPVNLAKPCSRPGG
jgi:hypothetical protein